MKIGLKYASEGYDDIKIILKMKMKRKNDIII